MNRFTRFAIFTAACLFLLGQVSAFAAERVKLNLMSTPFGTGSYVIASALETIINKNDYPFTFSHSETPGQMFNVMKLRDKALRQNTVVTGSMGINWLAERGQKPFKEKYTPTKLLATYNVIGLWLASTSDKITTMEDLRGKRVAIGRVPQVAWGYEPDAVLRCGYGDDFYKSLKVQFVGTTESVTALINGQVDVAGIGGYLNPITGQFSPSPQTVEALASGRTMYHLDWTKEAVEKTVQKDIAVTPYHLPANSLDGQTNPLWLPTDTVSFAVHPEFPEEMAYQIVKAILAHVKEFADYHDLGKLMTPEMLVFGWPEDTIHPGALRAYKEAGVLK